MKMMMVVLLLLISQHASGVEVYEGEESVLLPCQVPADVSRNSTSAVWDREDLSDTKVHLRRQKSGNLDERDDDSGQSDLYQHRTSMRVDALQTGDLSLTLRNPTVSDSGTYTCTAVSYGDRLSRSEVQLKVTVPPVWPKVLTAVLVTLIIPAAAGLFVYCAYKRLKDREALQTVMVEVPQGEKFALLPFKTRADLCEDDKVEWTLTEPKLMLVHVYESGNNQPDEQDQGYRGRTEMKEDPLRTKDLSLTLKDLQPTDSGVYTCTIYNKDGKPLLKKIVTLRVIVPPPKVVNVTDADESVLLPFKTTADLPQDVTVEWRDSNNMKLHVYKNGNNQPDKQHQDYRGRTEMKEDPLRTKDLSLTLKHPQTSHTGVYTCTVYNKDRDMILQQSVILSVTEGVPDIVQQQRSESVLLPFKTTADLPQDATVEWTLTEPKHMQVHVYESGNNQLDEQDHGYRDRTEMNEDPLRTKDLSLTLKHLHPTDSGVYTCTVYNKDGYKLQKSVTLHVFWTIYRMGTMCGDKSYLLEFQKTDQLDQISKVEWKRIYPKYKFIKEITRRQGNEKDLSLNLEDLHLSDSGVYTCTAYGENGDILLGQSVIFSVKDFQVEKVEVDEGEESVLLPFKTTADLHDVVKVYWILTENRDCRVHEYEKGKDNLDLQHKDYKGRTEMNEDPLRSKDLSLTLKKPLLTDSRSYTCTVGNKDGRILLRKVVTLTVRATLKGTIEDMLPCLRRRTAPKPEVKEDVRNTYQEGVSLMGVHSA